MSRTLGFIAGLTVPAGIYYVSVLHLQGTTNSIKEALHEQSLRLAEPTKSTPLILEPRDHSTLLARIWQGWNDGIERGVRFAQETDWEHLARRTGSTVSNLSRAAWDKAQPTVEAGKDKLHEISEASTDAAQRAGEAVGSNIHDGRVQAHRLAHEAQVKGHQLGEDLNTELHRLSRVAREDAVEAKQILHKAEKKAEAEYGRLEAQGAQKFKEVKSETVRKAQQASSVLSNVKTAVAEKIEEVQQSATAIYQDTKKSTTDLVGRAEKKAESTVQTAREKVEQGATTAEDRYAKLLESSQRSTDMKFKELEEQFGKKRIGFSRVNDPTDAAKHVQTNERSRRAPVPIIKDEAYDFFNVGDIPAVLQNTA